jgi:hypothetical protein
MRFLRNLIVLLVVVFLVVGTWRGWFSFWKTSSDGKTNIGVTVDPNKMKEDKEKVTDKVKDLENKIKDKNSPAADKPKDAKPSP